MSIQQTEEILLDFLKNPEPQVVAIKWDWWSGKTHFWNDFLKKHRNDTDLWFKKYSYCSIFWLKSLEEIRQSIFQNAINSEEIGRDIEFSLGDIKKSSFWRKGWKNIAQILDKTPIIKEYNPWAIYSIWILWLLKPKDTLVCIDDFERMSNNLDPVEVLGVISELKEQRKCKVLIIFNDSKLEKETEKTYKEFREKVIDMEISFQPTPKECSEIIFGTQIDNLSDEGILSSRCVSLEIRNIRILRKIYNITKLVLPHLTNYGRNVSEQAIAAICLFSYSYYSHSWKESHENIPNPEHIFNFSYLWDLIDGTHKDENEKNWNQFLYSYGWTNTDDFDRSLFEVIKRWYVIEDSLIPFAQATNEQFIAGDIEKLYSNIWSNYYHVWFSDNEGLFVDEIVRVFTLGSKFLNGSHLNAVVIILKKLWRSTESENIIDIFIEANNDNPEKLEISNFSDYLSNPVDDDLKAKFLSAYNYTREVRTLKEVLDSIIARNDSYWMEDEEIIFASTEEEIYEVFKNNNGDVLRQYRRILLRYRKVSNPSEQWRLTTEKTENALKRFGNTPLNILRLKSYWIDLIE